MQKILLTTIAALALLGDLASGTVHKEKGFTESEMIFCSHTWNAKWPGAMSCLCQCAIYSETIHFFFNVIRAVDCTHIVIKMPSQDKFVYVNIKNFHSITLQEH